MGSSSLVELKLSSARDRCWALSEYLDALESRGQFPPELTSVLLSIREAINAVQAALDRFKSDPDTALFSDAENETRIHRVTQCLPLLLDRIGLVERSDVSEVPAELTAPLTQIIRRFFPSASVLVVASSNLNYSIVELAEGLRKLLHSLRATAPSTLPAQLFRISVPAVEFDQALLHCILSHELGHPLFEKYDLAGKVLPIEVDERLLTLFYQAVKSTAPPGGDGPSDQLTFDEIAFKADLATRVNRITLRWIEELTSDLYGVLLFGPAYIYSFIHFFSAAFRLDAASEDHPPARLRLQVCLTFLGKRFPDSLFSEKSRTLIEAWRELSKAQAANPQDQLFEFLALATIKRPGVLERLMRAVEESLPAEDTYAPAQYTFDLERLCPLIDAHIPPVEFLEKGELQLASLVGILNAGWEAFISGMANYSRFLPGRIRDSDAATRRQFNRFIMKAIELNQIARTWKEAKN